MKSSILVTGGNGFIGRHILPILQGGSYEIHAISRNHVENNSEHITWHQADLLNLDSVSELLKEIQPDKLLHMAWDVTPGNYLESDTNFLGLHAGMHLFKEFIANGGSRIVGAGTCFEYDVTHGNLQEDLTPTTPRTYYGSCKKHLYEIAQEYCFKKDVEFAWGRIFYLYGPYEHPSRFIPTIILSHLQGEPAKCSHGYQIRDYLYVKDVASAFSSLCSSDFSGAINIGSGIPVTLRQIVNIIKDIIGNDISVNFSDYSPTNDDIPMILADTRKLKDLLHWSPQYSLFDGLRETVDWWINSNSKKKHIM